MGFEIVHGVGHQIFRQAVEHVADGLALSVALQERIHEGVARLCQALRGAADFG